MVKRISIDELMEWYEDTLQKIGMFLLDELNDEIIGYYIFEEVDIGLISFFYHDNLVRLHEAGYINEVIMEKSRVLRQKFIVIQDSEQWNVASVKTSIEWRNILMLADEIKVLLNSI
jgi:hypothetical protein